MHRPFVRGFFSRAPIFLATLLWAQVSAAQETGHHAHDRPRGNKHTEQTAATQDLPGVTVTGLPGAPAATDVTRPVAILEGAELDRDRAATLGETVARIPGVQSSGMHATGRPVIRGLDGPRVAVTANGLGVADAATISQDHATAIEPFLASQIEVLKGPASLLYGSGAIGGVVNVVDDRIPSAPPEKAFSGRAEIRHGSAANGHTAMARLDGGNADFAWHADAANRDEGDYAIPGGRLANSALASGSGSVGASWFGSAGWLGASVSRLAIDYGSPAEPGDAALGIDPVRIGLVQTRHDLKARFELARAGLESLDLGAASSRYRHTEWEGQTAATVFAQQAREARALIAHQPLAGWHGNFGLQHSVRDFSAQGEETFVPPTRTRALGVFLTESRSFGSFVLDLGLRRESTAVAPEHNVRRSFRPRSASAALGWQTRHGWRLTLNLDQAARAPSEQELFAHGPHEASASYEVGNAKLDVETAHQVELGAHYASRVFDAKVSVYANRYRGFIHLAADGAYRDGLAVRHWNQRDARFRGAEAEASWHLAQSGAGDFDLRFWGDVVRAEFRAQGQPLPRIPAARLGSNLVWNAGNWRAGAAATRYHAQRRIAPFETPTAGFTLLDANLAWSFHQSRASQWEAFVDARNLGNQNARLATSLFKDDAPLPGRNLVLGVRSWF